MRSHRLARLLLDADDGEIVFMKDNMCCFSQKFNLERKIDICGIMNRGPGNEVYLVYRFLPNEEEQKRHAKLHSEISSSHKDRLLSASLKIENLKEKAIEVIKEAKDKGYTIIEANDPNRKMFGYIAYKEIEGIELAYNPLWPESDGRIDL